MPTATIEHLCYWYPWSEQVPAALFDVSLELKAGLTLVGGDSGSGKSTLLRLLNGLVPHFHGGRIAGSAVVAGMDVLATPTRVMARRVGFVFQEAEVGSVRGTVAREVAFGPENLGFDPRAVEALVGAALERVGIAGLGGRRLSTLSGGERQRVALAAALAAAPETVALDEPTSQLDQTGITALRAILDDLASDGHSVVVAEQRLGRLPGASRLLVMEGGRLAEPGLLGAGLLGTGTVAAGGAAVAGAVAGGAALAGAVAEGAAATRVAPSGEAWSLAGVTAGIAGRAVVEGVDLSGCAGEIVVLTGPNGAGKTTLLRTIAGLLPPLAGRAMPGAAKGQAPGGPRVAYLPQDPGSLLHRRSVLAELRQTLRWSQRADDPTRILGQLGLGDLASRDPRDLSTGQRQRAALAAVLVGRPALALLDEPTRGMDAGSRLALAKVLRGLAGDACSVVLATHDAELATELGDRVVLVEGGRAVAVAPTVEAAR